MDHYDKAKSVNNASSLTPPTSTAHATGVPEYPNCQSDLYPDYLTSPTIELINLIEGAGLTRSATNKSQVLAAVQALAASAASSQAIKSGKLENTGAGTSGTLTITHGIDLADSSLIRVHLHSLCGNGGSGNSNFPCHGTLIFRKSGGTWSNEGSYALANGTSTGDADIVSSSGTTATFPTLAGGTISIQQTVVISDGDVDITTTVSSGTGFQVTATVEVL